MSQEEDAHYKALSDMELETEAMQINQVIQPKHPVLIEINGKMRDTELV